MTDKYQSLREKLNDSVDDITPQEQAELQHRRRKALDQFSEPKAKWALNWWAPVGNALTSVKPAGAALAFVGIAVGIWLYSGINPQQNEPDMNLFLVDADILTTPEELQLFEDLELYNWLLDEAEKES